MKNFVIVVCVVLFGAGCNSSKNMARLNDVKWVLVQMSGKEVKLSDSNSEINIQFNEAEKRVNGRGGCNRFFGNYVEDGSSLKFSPMGATRMACPDLQLEQEFFKMLEGVDSFAIKGGELILRSGSDVVAIFRMEEEPKK